MKAIESPYITQADVHMRLDKTYCMYNGEPVYVTVNQQFKCGEIHIRKLRDLVVVSAKVAETKLITIDDPKFSMVLPELGYINHGNGCAYLLRNPERRQKQGMYSESVHFHLKGLNQSHRWSESSLVFSSGFADSLEGKYPTYKEALAAVRSTNIGCAFDRNFALIKIDRNLIGLFYRNTCVGTLTNKNTLSVIESRMVKIINKYASKHGIELQ